MKIITRGTKQWPCNKSKNFQNAWLCILKNNEGKQWALKLFKDEIMTSKHFEGHFPGDQKVLSHGLDITDLVWGFQSRMFCPTKI